MDGLQARRPGRCFTAARALVIALVILTAAGAAWGMPARPGPVYVEQPDGSVIELRIRGDEHFNWHEDTGGYTVVQAAGWFEYARRGPNGKLVPTGLRVGAANPAAAGLTPRILPDPAVRAASALRVSGQGSQSAISDIAAISPAGTVRNLVVMVRFADHVGRTLPSSADMDVLFNSVGGDPSLAPTGSIRDVYYENSYGQLTLVSTISGWITVSGTESYYANGCSGTCAPYTLWEGLNEALDILDASIDFDQFDQDNDGYIDSITFIHSGYGAEWGGNANRIWSHRWAIQIPSGGWVSDEGVRVFDYHISPGLWGTSGSNIGRIGVIAHETGHFFGLPDLYDTSGSGEGIGSWGLMANSWAFDGQQRCPPHFSPWSKERLGWYTPTVISEPGQYTLNEAAYNPEVYRIDEGFPSNEYLLIENRQNAGFDCSIPQGGLIVWHIDEQAGYNTEGYPGQTGWPENGNHYRVAVLQADGLYDLERSNDRGDAGDAHHAAGVDAIGPGPGNHPNTDAYQGGNVYPTGIAITDISASGPTMTFCLDTCTALAAPSGLNATADGTDTIDLAWNDNSPDETGFEIEGSADGVSYAPLASVAADVTAWSETGLAPATTRHYRVRATNSESVSGWSNNASATTDDVPPAAPTGLAASADGADTIDLAWTDNADNEAGYRVERSSDGVAFSTRANLGANAQSFSDTGLPASTTFHYRVAATNSAGEAYSNSDSARTDDPPPWVDYTAVADVAGQASVSGNYTDTRADDGVAQALTERESGGRKRDRHSFLEHGWQFSIAAGDAVSVHANAYQSGSSEGDAFDFAWSDDGSTYEPLFSVTPGETGVDHLETATLPASTSGTVWIRVTDSDQSQGASNLDTLWVDHLYIRVENFGPPTPPEAPSALSATAAGDDRIDLAWTDNAANETGFEIESSPDGSTWSPAASVGADVTAWSDTGLAPETPRSYRVRATNDVGDSAWSNTASATTDPFTPPQPPAAPTGLSATVAGSDAVTLSWTDNADNENGFTIEQSEDGVNFSAIDTVSANVTSRTVGGLAADTEYFFRVLAYNADGDSGYSNVASAITDPAPAITLTLDGYKVRGVHHVDVTWSGATGASVDIHRDTTVITTDNDGAYTDNIGNKGGASYDYRVCEAGSATMCSPVVTVTF